MASLVILQLLAMSKLSCWWSSCDSPLSQSICLKAFLNFSLNLCSFLRLFYSLLIFLLFSDRFEISMSSVVFAFCMTPVKIIYYHLLVFRAFLQFKQGDKEIKDQMGLVFNLSNIGPSLYLVRECDMKDCFLLQWVMYFFIYFTSLESSRVRLVATLQLCLRMWAIFLLRSSLFLVLWTSSPCLASHSLNLTSQQSLTCCRAMFQDYFKSMMALSYSFSPCRFLILSQFFLVMIGCFNLSSKYHILDLRIFSCWAKLTFSYQKSARIYSLRLDSSCSQLSCFCYIFLASIRVLEASLFIFLIYWSLSLMILAKLEVYLSLCSISLTIQSFSFQILTISRSKLSLTLRNWLDYLSHFSISLVRVCFQSQNSFLVFNTFNSISLHLYKTPQYLLIHSSSLFCTCCCCSCLAISTFQSQILIKFYWVSLAFSFSSLSCQVKSVTSTECFQLWMAFQFQTFSNFYFHYMVIRSLASSICCCSSLLYRLVMASYLFYFLISSSYLLFIMLLSFCISVVYLSEITMISYRLSCQFYFSSLRISSIYFLLCCRLADSPSLISSSFLFFSYSYSFLFLNLYISASHLAILFQQSAIIWAHFASRACSFCLNLTSRFFLTFSNQLFHLLMK